MIFKVKSATDKQTSTGKAMKALVLVDTEGKEHSVNIFADFPRFAEIVADAQIDGELKQNDKGYTNLYSNEVPAKKPGNGAYKQKVIEEAMDRKEKSIDASQERKEWGIKVSSTMNKAVELAIAEYTLNKQSLDPLERCVLKWRDFLWENWDVELTDKPPF